MKTVKQPRLIDDDHGNVIVMQHGRQIRGWSYQNENERRIKMLCAREYIEGYMDGAMAAVE